MIQRFTVSNYKALREVSVNLTPVHALIGPNDSGKTSILEALAALSRSVDMQPSLAFGGAWKKQELLWQGAKEPVVSFSAAVEWTDHSFEYEIAFRFPAINSSVLVEAERIGVAGKWMDLPSAHQAISGVLQHFEGPSATLLRDVVSVHDALTGVQYCRFNPRFLALPVAADASRQFQLQPSGFGLAQCLDDILGFDRNRFAELEARFRYIFTAVKAIRLLTQPAYRAQWDHRSPTPIFQPADGKGLNFELAGSGKLVPASQMSDGVLLVLAYLTLLYLPQPPRLILIEEPENGIHPKRLQDVLQILRDLVKEQSRSQVVLTTHSPYVLDLFTPAEVSLCKKEDDGSVSVHSLSESEKVRDQLDVFGLGEIWTSEGDDALATTSRPSAGEAR